MSMTFKNLFKYGGTEQDIREHLQSVGYDGRSARFDSLELIAIERPGWVQVFKFGCRVLDDRDQISDILGVFRGDERSVNRVALAKTALEQEQVVEDWSRGLIRLNRDRSRVIPLLIAALAVILGIAIVGPMLSSTG